MKTVNTKSVLAGFAAGIFISGISGIISVVFDAFPMIPWSALIGASIIVLWFTFKYPLNDGDKRLFDCEVRIKELEREVIENTIHRQEPSETSTRR